MGERHGVRGNPYPLTIVIFDRLYKDIKTMTAYYGIIH